MSHPDPVDGGRGNEGQLQHPRTLEALGGLARTGFAVLDHFYQANDDRENVNQPPLSGMISEMDALMCQEQGIVPGGAAHHNEDADESRRRRKVIGRFEAGELAGNDGFWQTRYDPTKRSDFIAWLSENEIRDPTRPMPHLASYLDQCRRLAEGIRCGSLDHQPPLNLLARAKGAGVDKEASDGEQVHPPALTCDRLMLALYPLAEPSRFATHVDNPNSNGRVLTFTFYLNNDWDVARDGGELRIHKSEGSTPAVTTIEPVYNRLVVFLSDSRTPHEVLPTKPTPEGIALHPYRRSITLWFSYLTPEEERLAYAGAFRNWISRIQHSKLKQLQQ